MPELSKASKHRTGFAKAGTSVFALSRVQSADFSRIEHLEVKVLLKNGQRFTATEIDALELAMLLKPSVLESRRLRWKKLAWAFHNLVGHPLMQILAFMGMYKSAFWVHDATVPRPAGQHKKFQNASGHSQKTSI